MAVIACIGLDPVVLGLVRRVRPADDVVEVELEDLVTGRWLRYAAVVATASEDVLAVISGTPLAPRTVLVAQPRDEVDVLRHPGPIVRRPVEVTELRLALGRVAPPGRLARWRRRLSTASTSTSVDGIFAVARVGAVTAASALALTNPMRDASYVLVIVLVVWTAIRVGARQSSRVLVAVDAFLVVGAVLLTGGTSSPFLLFAAVAAAEVGYSFTTSTVAVIVGAGAVAGLVPLSIQLLRGTVDALYLVAWSTLLPMASAIGVLGARIQHSRERGTIEALEEMHHTLDRLARQAHGVVGTLEVSSVAERVLNELRRDVGAVAAVLVVGDVPVREVIAATGLSDAAPARVVMSDTRSVKPPQVLLDLLPAGEVVTVPLRVFGVDRGAIVAVLPDDQARRQAEDRLETVAREAALALDNARLFQGIQRLSVDTERRRLARDLHDGVIQSLVHLGLELDLVGSVLEGESAEDLHRLRRVVATTVDEVRATVNDLRSARLSGGLGPALRSLARDYEKEGLDVTADVGPVGELAPEAELQLFRIAQEAVSNAVHHGQPSTVLVRLWESERALHLQVLDDGVGLPATPGSASGDGRGVGLRAMQERVDLLGARLDLGPGDGGGTCVQVDLPREGARP